MTDILKEKTKKVLTRMSIPISVGMLSTFLFQVIDTYFIGQLGATPLVALSFSSTIYFILISLYIGLSIGVSIIVGSAIGAGNKTKAVQTTWVSMVLALLISVFLTGLFITLIDPIFTIMGADANALPLIRAYTIPLLIGMPLLAVGIMASGILRASGNVTSPEVVMGIAGVINLIFDYGLIFGHWGLPELGIEGAAYATVLSWIFVFIGMAFLMIKNQVIRLISFASLSLKSLLSEIFKLSSPTIVTQMIGPFTITALTIMLAQISELAVAAFGVASRIEMLLMIGVLSVSTAMTPFIAQNAGAGEQSRINQAIVFGGKASTYLGIIIAVLLFLFVKPIAGIFSDDLEVISYTSNYFYIVSASYAFYALYLITTAIFNGLTQTVKSLKISLVKSFVFTIPLACLGSLWGVMGIFIGLALSNVLAGIYASTSMHKYFKNTHSNLEHVNVVQAHLNDIKGLFSKKS